MKPLFATSIIAVTLATGWAASTLPASAQDYYRTLGPQDAYRDGVYPGPVYPGPVYPGPVYPGVALRPPRAVPIPADIDEEADGTIVTTTRRIINPPDEYGVGTSRTVVTTRRVSREREPLAIYSERPVDVRPLPPLRQVVSKDPYAPPRRIGRYDEPLHLGARELRRPATIIEERRVETTRRYLAPDRFGPERVDFEE